MRTAAPKGGGANGDRGTTRPSFSTSSDAAPQAPCRRLGVICADIVTNLRRQRLAERLHRLGPRPVLEALAEVEAGKPLDTVLAEYARLDPDIVNALHGDDFPPSPLYVLGST